MMKSQQSATKLRLSKLVRGLLILGCIKLIIMGVALFDLPMPSWNDKNVKTAVVEKEFTATVNNEPIKVAPAEAAGQSQPAATEAMPQGSAAAELAAAAKPRPRYSSDNLALPAPLLSANPVGPSPIGGGAAVFTPLLPQPPSLGAPLAKAGIILPQDSPTEQTQQNDSIWNMLNIKSLPIPILGSAQAAHAAAVDMPVPNTPPYKPAMTPAEQIPLNGNPTVLPGAPPLNGNFPRGQQADGSPLPPREGAPSQSGSAYAPPAGNVQAMNGPAPNISPSQSFADQNTKAQELARQQQDILMLRQQMDQRLKDLQSAEDKMKDMINEAKNIEDKKVKSLVQMYANMKPRMAAQALENMDERIAVRILSGMAPKQSGEILTYTNPAKTAKFTEMITRLRMGE